MTKEEKQKLSNEIKYDIETGVYDLFPKLKERLLFIVGKLFESIYVINSSKELSINERKTLSEQGYIEVTSFNDNGRITAISDCIDKIKQLNCMPIKRSIFISFIKEYDKYIGKMFEEGWTAEMAVNEIIETLKIEVE